VIQLRLYINFYLLFYHWIVTNIQMYREKKCSYKMIHIMRYDLIIYQLLFSRYCTIELYNLIILYFPNKRVHFDGDMSYCTTEQKLSGIYGLKGPHNYRKKTLVAYVVAVMNYNWITTHCPNEW
jgi:hypothetical protein